MIFPFVSSHYVWCWISPLGFGISLIFSFGLTILSILIVILRFDPLNDSGNCLSSLARSGGDTLPGLFACLYNRATSRACTFA
jgi:hypothetical protein